MNGRSMLRVRNHSGGRQQSEMRLEPQVMDLLVLFAGSPGEVLSKDRIIASVWSGRAIGDDTLAAAISRLRTALGSTKHIETIPKRGYRLVIAPDQAAIGHARRAESGADSLISKGFAILKSPTPLTLGQSKLYFESAIKMDAARADAHAGLAQTSLLQHLIGSEPSAPLLRAAQAAARAALALDDHYAFAWAVLGCATLFASIRNFAAADAAFPKSARLRSRLERGASLSRNGACCGRPLRGGGTRSARSDRLRDPVSLSARGELLQYLLLARHAYCSRAQLRKPSGRSLWSHWRATHGRQRGWAHFLAGRRARGAGCIPGKFSRSGAWVQRALAKLTEAFTARAPAMLTASSARP